MNWRKLVEACAVAFVATALLSSCFSFESGGMIRFKWGIRAGTSTIKRHASRDLVTFSSGSNDYRRGKAASKILRTAMHDVKMPKFFRDRWNAATSSDQYADLGEDLRSMEGHSRCLAMTMKAGWASWGYDWFTYPFGSNGCDWGRDPVPTSP